MSGLTFCTAGGLMDVEEVSEFSDFSEVQASLAAGYRGVSHPPVVYFAKYGGAQINGFACVERVGGVFVQPAEVVLGLRAWHDAFEGVLGDAGAGERPWVLYEAEKIVRMMLRQSGLALEILASPVGRGLDVRRIVRAAITREIVHYYRDVTRLGVERLLVLDGFGGEDRVWLQDLFRNLLTGCVLGQQGHVSLHLDALFEFPVAAGVAEPLAEVLSGRSLTGALRALGAQAVRLQGLLEIEHAGILPERPADYDGLNEWLINERFCRRNEQ